MDFQASDYPTKPGCYVMKNEEGLILYIGKAKQIRKRLASYFRNDVSRKTSELMKRVEFIDWIVTNTEREALILENQLIKEYKPKYNIRLKDDKQYPYLLLTNETHPRLLITRNRNSKGTYYGPFPSGTQTKEVLTVLNREFPLRKCHPIPKETCLYWDLGQCLAPCVNQVGEQTYKKLKKQIHTFFQTNGKEWVKTYEEKMVKAAESELYERAAEYRDRIKHINLLFKEEQGIENNGKKNIDIIGYSVFNDKIAIGILHIRYGKLLKRTIEEINRYGDETAEECIASSLVRYYENEEYKPTVYIPQELESEEWGELSVQVPKRGFYQKQLLLASENTRLHLEQGKTLAEKLANVLGVRNVSVIDIIDNSHISGSYNTSAVLRYIDGKRKVSETRYYDHENGYGNDFFMMNETVRRHTKQLLLNQKALPDVLLVDGGLIQVNAVKTLLQDEYGLFLPIFGLVKTKKHKTSGTLVDENGNETFVSDEMVLRFLTRMQDDVHRTVLTHHRKKRNKSMKKSLLDEVKGLGEARKRKLLTTFGSIKGIVAASDEEILGTGVPRTVLKELKRVIKKK